MADALYLIRHSAPPPEVRDKYWGKKDPGVDPDCLLRTEALASLIWAKPDRLLSSPLARAEVTAERLGAGWGLPVETVAELAEIDYGIFDGLSKTEIREQYPVEAARWSREGSGFTFPGGEACATFYVRVKEAWRRCLEIPEKTVACVTHGGIISAWCCLFLGMDLDERCVFRAEYSAVTAFLRKRDGSGWELVYFNNKE